MFSEGRSATTIAAISSPPGPARRGVIRLSGPRTAAIVGEVFAGGEAAGDRLPRGVRAGRFRDARGEQPALLFWMPGPHSYTREDVAELHLPGCAPLLDAALARLLELGAEPAAPGEFTRRAFLHGRFDLTEAEGVLELIEASNEDERRAAGLLLEGGLGTRIDGLRDGLEDLRSLCEASLDFDAADTGDVPTAELEARAAAAARDLDEALGWEVRRQSPHALPRVVLQGPPNAGKSSLFNALTRPEFGALVSAHAGTTRDPIAAVWELPRGVPCLLLDAPGHDPAAEGVDAAAQALAAREARRAALVLWVTSVGEEATDGGRPTSDVPSLRVQAKSDLHPAARGTAGAVRTSARGGTGLDALGHAVEESLGLAGRGAARGTGLARELFARHRRALVEGAALLARARRMLGRGEPLDLVAETLRGATDALDGIAGRTSSEDVLDRIFSRFCIGK